jgi:hypothetical protein
MLESEEGKAGAAVVKPPPQALRGGWREKDVPQHAPYVFPSRSYCAPRARERPSLTPWGAAPSTGRVNEPGPRPAGWPVSP